MNAKDVEFQKWDLAECVKVGLFLLELLACEQVGLITYTKQKLRE